MIRKHRQRRMTRKYKPITNSEKKSQSDNDDDDDHLFMGCWKPHGVYGSYYTKNELPKQDIFEDTVRPKVCALERIGVVVNFGSSRIPCESKKQCCQMASRGA